MFRILEPKIKGFPTPAIPSKLLSDIKSYLSAWHIREISLMMAKWMNVGGTNCDLYWEGWNVSPMYWIFIMHEALYYMPYTHYNNYSSCHTVAESDFVDKPSFSTESHK